MPAYTKSGQSGDENLHFVNFGFERDLDEILDNNKEAVQTPTFPIPDGVLAETVTEVQHFTDGLFRFRITRPASFRFRSGEFAMIGLPNSNKPVYRAYSVASPTWDETLEFYSIKIPDGPLTEHLSKIQPGDTVLLKPKATGTLVHDVLLPGSRLWLLSTGTGIAPFASLIRDPETYERFENITLVHTCRDSAELQYGFDIVAAAKNDPLIGEYATTQLSHIATTTRETSEHMGRITTLIESGQLFDQSGTIDFSVTNDRIMICGSMAMLKDLKAMLLKREFNEGSNREPGHFAVERAFVGD